jgi:hypothetical protein
LRSAVASQVVVDLVNELLKLLRAIRIDQRLRPGAPRHSPVPLRHISDLPAWIVVLKLALTLVEFRQETGHDVLSPGRVTASMLCRASDRERGTSSVSNWRISPRSLVTTA